MTQIIGTACALIALTLFPAYVANGQTRASADIVERNGKTVMLAAYDLDEDPGDCAVRKYLGTIIKVHYDQEFGVQIDGFTLQGPRGLRTYFNVDPTLYGDFRLPRAEIGWLPMLIKRNNRVRVEAYVCGASGGVVIANNIISVRSPS